MDDIMQVFIDNPRVKQAFEFLDEVVSVSQWSGGIAVATKHNVYFMHFDENIDLWQVIHGMTEQGIG